MVKGKSQPIEVFTPIDPARANDKDGFSVKAGFRVNQNNMMTLRHTFTNRPHTQTVVFAGPPSAGQSLAPGTNSPLKPSSKNAPVVLSPLPLLSLYFSFRFSSFLLGI
jgi:hypothetical protein